MGRSTNPQNRPPAFDHMTGAGLTEPIPSKARDSEESEMRNELDELRAELAAVGAHDLAALSDDDLTATIEAIELAQAVEQHPQGDAQGKAAYAAGRKWAIKTAQRYGVAAIPKRFPDAVATKTNYRDEDLVRFGLAVFDAWVALGDGREPPVSRVTIQ